MPPSKKQSRPEVAVTRDVTFHRAVADKVLAFDLGRDIELSFLQGGPIIKKMIDWDEDSEQAQLGGSLTEVARIRVSGPVALSIAVNLIDTLVGADKIKIPAFRETLSQIFEAHSARESEKSE